MNSFQTRCSECPSPLPFYDVRRHTRYPLCKKCEARRQRKLMLQQAKKR